jgi:hypothetical protein
MARTVRMADQMNLSSQAKKQWEKIPKEVRLKLLNNAYCSKCGGSTGIAEIEGSVDRGDLVLRGKCTTCGKPVARVIETSEIPDPS